MPNPAIGSGADVSKGLKKYKYALYVADASGAAVVPANKLGAASEPASPWVRVGRLAGDAITYNIGDLDWLIGRAGFDKSEKWRVVNQAEAAGFTISLDEEDPDVQARLRGTTATSLSSGSNTGQEYIYKTGTFYSAKVLLVGLDATGGVREKHVFIGKAVVSFKPTTTDTHDGLDVAIFAIDTSATETFRTREWE